MDSTKQDERIQLMKNVIASALIAVGLWISINSTIFPASAQFTNPGPFPFCLPSMKDSGYYSMGCVTAEGGHCASSSTGCNYCYWFINKCTGTGNWGACVEWTNYTVPIYVIHVPCQEVYTDVYTCGCAAPDPGAVGNSTYSYTRTGC